MTKIFNDSNFRRKEKLVVMLMSQNSDFIVGKTISLQLITLVCVCTKKIIIKSLQFAFSDGG